MILRRFSSLAILALGGLAGCHGASRVDAAAGGVAGARPDAGYLAPPMPDQVRATPGGLLLSGAAPAGGKVRLAAPGAQARYAAADASGRWSILIPVSADAQIFGLSVSLKDRAAQAEGYVFAAPTGQAAMLRAGSGAVRLDQADRAGVRAIDFDQGGGAAITAGAPAGATVLVRLDGRQIAEGKTDASGRFEVEAPGEVRGGHRAQVFTGGAVDTVAFQVSRAAPLAAGPFHSQLTGVGLRIDWMTPGGGVQSTILVH